MSEVACWRCDRLNESSAENCDGCGVKSPSTKPANTAKPGGPILTPYPKVSSSSQGSSGLFGSRSSTSQSRNIADRLKREAGVALSWIYIQAWIATVLVVLAFLFLLIAGISLHLFDFWQLLLSFLASAILVALIWVQTMIYAPFYSYMSMRAHQVLENNDK
jgi:hypothetical protein